MGAVVTERPCADCGRVIDFPATPDELERHRGAGTRCEGCRELVSAFDVAGEWFHVSDTSVGADVAGPQCDACGCHTYAVVVDPDRPRVRWVECDSCGDRSPICLQPTYRVVF